MPDVPAAVSLFFLSGMHNKDLGWPAGGSLAFARGIEHRYLELGGEIRYGARAAKILTENDRAVGVRLADGTEHRADLVVSAADGHATIFEMLEGRYTNEKIRRYYAKPPRTYRDDPPGLAGRGPRSQRANRTPSSSSSTGRSGSPARTGPSSTWRLFNFDPSMAPAGKTALKVMLETGYDYWKDLKDKGGYEAEKQRVGGGGRSPPWSGAGRACGSRSRWPTWPRR